jgi:hypothetical protein
MQLLNLLEEIKQRLHGQPITFNGLVCRFESPDLSLPKTTQMPPSELNKVEYINDTAVNQTQTWIDTKLTTARHQVQLTHSVEVGRKNVGEDEHRKGF